MTEESLRAVIATEEGASWLSALTYIIFDAVSVARERNGADEVYENACDLIKWLLRSSDDATLVIPIDDPDNQLGGLVGDGVFTWYADGGDAIVEEQEAGERGFTVYTEREGRSDTRIYGDFTVAAVALIHWRAGHLKEEAC